MQPSRASCVLCLMLLGAAILSSSSKASERSELLVAQGEVAYNAGRVDDAQRRFEDALAADPDDQTAQAWLGVLAANRPTEAGRGERPERAARAWDLEAGTGVEYDSNVTLAHRDRREDAAFLFTLAGHVAPWRDDRTLVRLDYEFLEALHTRVRDFDVRSNRFRATMSRALTPALWVGLQGGYDHTTLDTHAYLQEPWVMPYVSLLEGDRGATQIVYRHGEQDYLGSPFGGSPIDRDGPLDAVGVTQLLFLFDHRLTATLGYAYEEATPHKASGDDFARRTHQGRVGLRFPAWWRTLVELDYVHRADDYSEPNSATGGRSTRRDDGNYLAAFVRRPILPHLDALLSYFATVNGSNIALYDYHRHAVALELRYTF
jgi:tetratricopeptide (TPR) repeat protein